MKDWIGFLAQWSEQRSHKPPVVSSSLTESTIKFFDVPRHIGRRNKRVLKFLVDAKTGKDGEWLFLEYKDVQRELQFGRRKFFRCLWWLGDHGYLVFQKLKYGGFEAKENAIAIKITEQGFDLMRKLEANRRTVQEWNDRIEQERQDYL